MSNSDVREFDLASRLYEELNKKQASGGDLDGAYNFDFKIGNILKEMVKITRAQIAGQDTGSSIQFADILDLLKGLVEEAPSLGVLKCELIFAVFEFMIPKGTSLDEASAELSSMIHEAVFHKFLSKKEFDSQLSFCKFLSRKFEAINRGKASKKAKFSLVDGSRELVRMFIVYFLLQNNIFLTRINSESLSEEDTKLFVSTVKNFLKVCNSLGLYDKKLDSLRDLMGTVKSSELLQSLQLLLCSVFSRFKAEEPHTPEEKSLKQLCEYLGGPIVDLD